MPLTLAAMNAPTGKPSSPVDSGAITVTSATAIGVGGMMGAALLATASGVNATMFGDANLT
jgi:hypothetical protein